MTHDVEILGTTIHTGRIATCGHCGQDDLRRTVRIRLDGVVLDVGETCAARIVGKSVRTIRQRATAADKSTRQAAIDAHVTWKREQDTYARRAASVYYCGPRYQQLYRAAAEEFATNNPEPPKPRR